MRTQNHGETPSQTRATIAVPAYRKTGLQAYLEAIVAMHVMAPFEMIVVLNDATAEVHATDIRITDMSVNLGLSGAFNHAFALGTGEFLLELQDNAIPARDLISVLVARADATPDAGAIGALTIDGHGGVCDPGMIV